MGGGVLSISKGRRLEYISLIIFLKKERR